MASKENTEINLMGDLNISYLNNNDHWDLHHNSSSLIDVIFVKETSGIAKSEVLPMSISDHDMIGCVYKMDNMKFNGRTVRCRDYRDYHMKI